MKSETNNCKRPGLSKTGTGYFIGECPASTSIFIDTRAGNGYLHFLAGTVFHAAFPLQVKVHAVYLLGQHMGLIAYYSFERRGRQP